MRYWSIGAIVRIRCRGILCHRMIHRTEARRAEHNQQRDAEVQVLGRHGFKTAVKGKNGFVCIVGRSWTSAPDSEGWNPKVRVPMCVNEAARRRSSPLRLTKETEWGLAGRTQAQMTRGAVAAAIAKKNCRRWSPERCVTCCRSKATAATTPPLASPSHVFLFRYRPRNLGRNCRVPPLSVSATPWST